MFNYSYVIGVLNTNFAKFIEEKLMFDCWLVVLTK